MGPDLKEFFPSTTERCGSYLETDSTVRRPPRVWIPPVDVDHVYWKPRVRVGVRQRVGTEVRSGEIDGKGDWGRVKTSPRLYPSVVFFCLSLPLLLTTKHSPEVSLFVPSVQP